MGIDHREAERWLTILDLCAISAVSIVQSRRKQTINLDLDQPRYRTPPPTSLVLILKELPRGYDDMLRAPPANGENRNESGVDASLR